MNLILCFDGTGDWAATDTTNVMKMFERMDQATQTVYYAGGVGTLGNPIEMSTVRQTYYKLLDLATAKTISQEVLAGYCFLANNYRDPVTIKGQETEGDNIFLFGFSRGAYTARLVASLIHNFGLVKKEHINLAPYLWQTISSFRNFADFKHETATIRNDFARDIAVKVHFMGLFDTVSSVGIFERFNVYPYTDSNSSVEHIRHAVSIDERRNAFPELLIKPNDNDVVEIWFPGVHRDIGGGASPAGLSNQTLTWMIDEAHKFGLEIDTTPPAPEAKTPHYGGFDPYVPVGLYPMKMFDYSLENLKKPNFTIAYVVSKLLRRKPPNDPGFRLFWPNLQHVRRIPENAFVFVNENEVAQAGQTLAIGNAQNLDCAKYVPLRTNAFDVIGTFLGVVLAVLLGNGWLGSPLQRLFGTWPVDQAWHGLSSTFAFWIFAAYLIQQGFSQQLGLRTSTKWINESIPFLGVVASVALVAYELVNIPGAWVALYCGIALALVVTLCSQFGPKPILPAVRTVAYFVVPWFLIALVCWIVDWTLSYIWVYIVSAVDWLAFLRSEPWFTYEPYLTWVAWGLACATAMIGIANIFQDRAKTVDGGAKTS